MKSRSLVAVLGLITLLTARTASAQEDLRLLALDRVQVGPKQVTLAGVAPGGDCLGQAERTVGQMLAGQRGWFATLEGLQTDEGFVVLSNGRTVNELAMETGCARFDGAHLPAAHPYVKAIEQAWQRAEAASRTAAKSTSQSAASGGTQPPQPDARASAVDKTKWTSVAKWTGSADATTQPIDVPDGELRVLTLSIPNGEQPGQLTVVVYDESGTALQTITSGPLSAKRMDVSHVRTKPQARVYFAVAGAHVLWGVWVEVK